MDGFLNFLADYYIVFIVISGLLLFALIGFVVMGKKKKTLPGQVNMEPTPENPGAPVGPGVPAPGAPAPGAPVGPQPAPIQPTAPAQPEQQPQTLGDAAVGQQDQMVSDEPTLIINDPSATQPAAPTDVTNIQ